MSAGLRYEGHHEQQCYRTRSTLQWLSGSCEAIIRHNAAAGGRRLCGPLEIFFHGCPVPESLPILSGELLSRARVHSRLPPEPGAPARQNPNRHGLARRSASPPRIDRRIRGAIAAQWLHGFSAVSQNRSQIAVRC